MAELVLDSAIRFWVFLPIVIISFFFGVIKHYLTLLMVPERKTELQVLLDRYYYVSSYTKIFSHALIRSRLLRENGNYITRNVALCEAYFCRVLKCVSTFSMTMRLVFSKHRSEKT